MNIIETVVAGKHPDPARCEDRLITTGHLVAVIDGATDKSGRTVQTPAGDVTTGRFAADVCAAVLEHLAPGTSPREAVTALTDALDIAIHAALGAIDAADRPNASVVVYDETVGVVWAVGDCQFRIDDVVYLSTKRIDQITSDFRAAFLAASREADTGVDVGREAILPLLRIQGRFANQQGEFGYGVINGTPVPDDFITVVPVPPSSREIVLASDGYPTLPATLALAEDDLGEALAADPQCVAVLRSTKGLSAGAVSFDDRAWVRIIPG
jgi:hypothetical protein